MRTEWTIKYETKKRIYFIIHNGHEIINKYWIKK